GRLLDSNGKPAVGVHVQLAEIDERLDPELRYRARSPDRLELFGSRLPLAVVTDADGRFGLEGLPMDHSIGMLAKDPRFASQWLGCATIGKAEIDRLNAIPSLQPDRKL